MTYCLLGTDALTTKLQMQLNGWGETKLYKGGLT